MFHLSCQVVCLAHKVTLTGVVIRVRKNTSGDKVAIIKDSHSYLHFTVADRGFVKGQEVEISGRIIEVERGSGYIRLIEG